MIIAIQQPEHLPWIGFFNKMMQVDKFVLLDHVQFKKNYFENRNRIKTANGPLWLTIPVKLKGRFGQTFLEVEVSDNPSWEKKYLKTVEQTYKKAPYWDDIKKIIFQTFDGPCKFLIDINLNLIEAISQYLQIETPRIRSSTLSFESSQKGDLVLAICKALNADAYLSGPDGRNYLDFNEFKAACIRVSYNDFEHPRYTQMFGSFLSHMSVLDLIANSGPKSQSIVKGCYQVSN